MKKAGCEIMSVLEVILYLVTFLLLLQSFRKFRRQSWVSIFLVITVLVFVIHVITGFVRWQLLTLYIATFLLIVWNVLVNLDTLSKKGLLSKTIIFIVSTGFLISLIANLSFPIYEIPEPTGEHLIGTTVFEINDQDRDELYSDELSRRFMIQLWYPAEVIEGYEQAVWLEGGRPLASALAKDNFLPSFALNHATSILSNSYYDAPILVQSDKYPVVIISHGWRGFRTLHTDFAEELASHGYIVISIDHSYGSVATVFNSGVAYLNLDALESRETNDDFQGDSNALVSTYSGDIISTIDFLEELNGNEYSRFLNILDLESIGLVGHSTGGGAGVLTTLTDDRVDAVFGLDSWVEPIGQLELSKGISVPSVFLRSESWETGENNDYLYTLFRNSQYMEMYQISGTTHYDFAMVYMYSPLVKLVGFTGTIDSTHLTSILRTTMIDFFDQHLLNEVRNSEFVELEEVEMIFPE